VEVSEEASEAVGVAGGAAAVEDAAEVAEKMTKRR